MTWQMYCVIFRLRSPMHIGWNKIGNVQRTRPYITGRSLWGGLTMRLSRDRAYTQQRSASASDYQITGKWVHENLAFTYLYPAIQEKGNDLSDSFRYPVVWPWQEQFSYGFLSSYASTALAATAQSATEGTLHEVEFLTPMRIDTGEPVYLVGYIFVHQDVSDQYDTIKHALQRLQVGGERTYGWGRLELQEFTRCTDMILFFNSRESIDVNVDVNNTRPTLSFDKNGLLLAHTRVENTQAKGEIEPLVGREWRAMEATHNKVGQYVACNGVYFAPGTRTVTSDIHRFQIGNYGIWEPVHK